MMPSGVRINSAVCGVNMPVRKKMPLWTFSSSGVNRSKKSRSISVLLPWSTMWWKCCWCCWNHCQNAVYAFSFAGVFCFWEPHNFLKSSFFFSFFYWFQYFLWSMDCINISMYTVQLNLKQSYCFAFIPSNFFSTSATATIAKLEVTTTAEP